MADWSTGTARRLVPALALALLLTFPSPDAGAGDMTPSLLPSPASAVERLFRDEPIRADWFTPEFLAQVPITGLERLVAGMKAGFGPIAGIEGPKGAGPGAGALSVRLRDAEVPVRVTLDASGRIAGLWLEAPIPSGLGLDDHVKAIAALPGRTSVLVLTQGRVRAAHLPDEPLAVGSAAKLAVLKALGDAVASGRLAEEGVVGLREEWRSLPSGMLQDWPADTPLTIATLANLAISISDNTATDALIHLAGRDAVEAAAPRNAPFLTTREAFTLKVDEDLRARWREADAEGRRELLRRIEGAPLPSVLPSGVTAGIEWFLSARELCALLEETSPQPALSINPGLARREDWKSVAFKGGSEPGVLNFSTRLVAEDGTAHCVVATWNDDAPLDEGRLADPYRGLLRAVANG